jgi:hypothetical protein
MRSFVRTTSFVVVCLSLSALGCGSNNKGKIEGKWKIVSATGQEQEMKQLAEMNGYMYMEFKADGVLAIGFEMTDPAMKKMIEAAAPGKTSFALKYRLLSGDDVEFYDMPKEMQDQKGGGGLFGGGKDKAKTKIKIDGDNMTMTDSDGKSGTLTRVK